MGRLVGLELFNFKSYKGLAKIGFGDASFTSIIGPNGAGKSNMMDAISFVLGVQSSQLRSQQLKDLIYRGKLDSAASSSAAHVASNAYVCAIYEKDNGELVKFKRAINNHGSSDYQINETIVTALQYTMALKSEKILVKARNFLVFQGDIENVAAQSPKDLSRLIETISGSIEYAEEYDRLKEDSEKSHEIATQVFSRKRNLNLESKQYREQMRERELFESKLSEKYNLIKTYHLYKFFHNEKNHFQSLADLSRLNQQIASAKEAHGAKKEELTSLIAEISSATLIAKKLESEIKEHERQADTVRRSTVPIESSQKSLNNSITLTTSKLEELTRDLENQMLAKESEEARLRTFEDDLRNFEAKIEALQNKINVPPEGVQEYERLYNQFLRDSGSHLLENKSILSADKESALSSLQNLQEQSHNVTKRILELENDLQLKRSELAVSKSDLSDIGEQKTIKTELRMRLLKKEQEFSAREVELSSRLSKTQNRLNELSSQQNESKKQKKLRDNVLMLRKFVKENSVKGLLYELVSSSHQKYNTALQVALGQNFDSIVVESADIAYKCIEILKERRAGTATFIPLDSIVIEPININYLRSLDEAARPALDVVRFEDKLLERAVQYVLGNTIIVDSIDIARELKWSSSHNLNNKMVSIDGSIIHKSGLMTGGQQERQSGETAVWSKQEFVRLNREKEEIVEELSEVQSQRPKLDEIGQLDEELLHLEDNLPILRNHTERLEREIAEMEHEIDFQKKHQKSVDDRKMAVSTNLNEIESKLSDIENVIGEKKLVIFSQFCETYELTSISEYEYCHGPSIRKRAREKANFEKAISACNRRISFEAEQIKNTSSRIVKLEEIKSREEKKLEEVRGELDQQSIMLSNIENELAKLYTKKKEHSVHLQQLSKVSYSEETSIKTLESEMKSYDEDSANIRESLMKIDSERLNMFKNCKIDGVDLPLEDGFLESVSFAEGQDVSEQAYSIHLDYALLDMKLQERFSTKVLAELMSKIERVENEITALTPNANAIERLKEVDKKLREFDREFARARQDEKRSIAKFQEVKSLRTELFMRAFVQISDNIDSVYKELTKSSAAPLGGSAYLTLEDEDEPYCAGIRYHAMPPMKRFRDMDLLSGGEKTMAALSLLFTIHLFQPSPFFVLDEIDAALDNANVAKISNYIKKHARPGFQFIVISLKSSLFENSDALIGIYREQDENSSKTISLDLRRYDDDSVDPSSRRESHAIASA